jgi:hypothetical protein
MFACTLNLSDLLGMLVLVIVSMNEYASPVRLTHL